MTSQSLTTEPDPINLTSDDIAFLISLLREPAGQQPLTTQQLIEALRRRGGQ